MLSSLNWLGPQACGYVNPFDPYRLGLGARKQNATSVCSFKVFTIALVPLTLV